MTSKRDKSTVNRQIDENLKRVYEEALNQELPDQFKDLIAKLKAQEPDKDGK